MALILPGVMSARAASRRLNCLNNLRQLAIALLYYESQWGGYPPSSQCAGNFGIVGNNHCYSMQSLLLAGIEKNNLYNSINFLVPGTTISSANHANDTVIKTRVDVFICPADPVAISGPHAKNSYRANMGPCELCKEQGRGGFFFGRLGSLAEFTDGTSNTLLLAEKLTGTSQIGQFEADRDWLSLINSAPPVTAEQWISACQNIQQKSNPNWDSGATWLFPGGRYTWFFSSIPPNSTLTDCGVTHAGGVGVFGARSYHSGGVNASLGDGSVRFFKSSINPNVWRALGTRSNGEVLEAF